MIQREIARYILNSMKPSMAMDAERWVTVYPNGKRYKGRRVLIDEAGIIKGGLGGLFNGVNIKHISYKSKTTTEQTETPEIKSIKDKIKQYYGTTPIKDSLFNNVKNLGFTLYHDDVQMQPDLFETEDKDVLKTLTENYNLHPKAQDLLESAYSNIVKADNLIDKMKAQSQFKYIANGIWLLSKSNMTEDFFDKMNNAFTVQPEAAMMELANYETPMGERSPIPTVLPLFSEYTKYLTEHNFDTRENLLSYGFTQKNIPTFSDLQSMGFYQKGQESKPFDIPKMDAPHMKVTEEDINNARRLLEEDDYHEINSDPDMYTEWGHGNLTWASDFGSASSVAAAHSYAVKSNVLNQILRKDGKNLNDDERFWLADSVHVVKELDKIFAVSDVDSPMIVFRGIGDDAVWEKAVKEGEYKDKAYMSASTDLFIARQFAGDNGRNVIKILVPPHASAISMKNGMMNKYHDEAEILFPRQSKLVKVGFDDDEKIPVFLLVG